MNFGANWKTTAGGAASALGGAADFLTQLSTGHWDPARLMADWTAVTAGIGLIFAKDQNVTGGTVNQNQ